MPETKEQTTDGQRREVEWLHLPPRIPQLNPLKAEWMKIKVAIADIFDGLNRIWDAIREQIAV